MSKDTATGSMGPKEAILAEIGGAKKKMTREEFFSLMCDLTIEIEARFEEWMKEKTS